MTHRKGRVYTVNGLSPLPATQLRFMNEAVGAEQTIQVRCVRMHACVCMCACAYMTPSSDPPTAASTGRCTFVDLHVRPTPPYIAYLQARPNGSTLPFSHTTAPIEQHTQPGSTTQQAYFQTQYGIKLQFPGLHCVRMGSKRKPTYFPIEVRWCGDWLVG